MRGFGVDVFLPCLGRSEFFGEIKNHQYITILKFLQNGDDHNFSKYLDELITELSHNDVDYNELTRVDKLVVWLSLRTISVSPDLKLTFKCATTERDYKESVDLLKLVNAINELDWVVDGCIEVNSRIKLKYKLPKSVYIDSQEALFDECFYVMELDGDSYDLYSLSPDELSEVMSFIPTNIVSNVYKHIQDESDTLGEIDFLTYKSPYDQFDETKIYKLNVYDNGLYEFIKMLFTDNMRNHYQYNYILSTKSNIDINFA